MCGRFVLESDQEVLSSKGGSGPRRQLDVRPPRNGELGVAQSVLAPIISWHLPLGLDQRRVAQMRLGRTLRKIIALVSVQQGTERPLSVLRLQSDPLETQPQIIVLFTPPPVLIRESVGPFEVIIARQDDGSQTFFQRVTAPLVSLGR